MRRFRMDTEGEEEGEATSMEKFNGRRFMRNNSRRQLAPNEVWESNDAAPALFRPRATCLTTGVNHAVEKRMKSKPPQEGARNPQWRQCR